MKEELGSSSTPLKSSIEVAPNLQLKTPPAHLKYSILGESSTLLVFASSYLTSLQEEKVDQSVGRVQKRAIQWTLTDMHGIAPFFRMHKIQKDDNFTQVVQPQRKLSPNMKEAGKCIGDQTILDTGIIYTFFRIGKFYASFS